MAVSMPPMMMTSAVSELFDVIGLTPEPYPAANQSQNFEACDTDTSGVQLAWAG
jgi:hypothetical protein